MLTVELDEATATLGVRDRDGGFLRKEPGVSSASRKAREKVSKGIGMSSKRCQRQDRRLTFLPKVWTDCTHST